MRNYKLVLSYDGARYKGWQRLGNGEVTIQETRGYVTDYGRKRKSEGRIFSAGKRSLFR